MFSEVQEGGRREEGPQNSLCSLTLSAPLVVAVLALLALALEGGLALMTDHARSLRDGLLDVAPFRFRRGDRVLGPDLLGLLGRVPWALLALLMVAVPAEFVDAILSLATVACAVDPHADFLLHSRHVGLDRRRPFADLEDLIVFREQSADLLLLELGVLQSSHG